MKVLKFGGTSLKDAEKFLHVSEIICKESKKKQIFVVLSAPAKITNYLNSSIKICLEKIKPIDDIINIIKIFFLNLIKKIYILQKKEKIKLLETFIQNILNNLKKKLHFIKKEKKCTDRKKAEIISQGEIFSLKIMEYILKSKEKNVNILNPIDNIIAYGDPLNGSVDINESKKRIKKLNISKNDIVLMPGFFAGTYDKKIILLGKNGSDYSAAILSACINANICEIWTDVNGIYTCDPRKINNTFLIKNISYIEAKEMSFLGATVIHPSTIEPLQKNNIPCIVKNTNNPNVLGTLITNKEENKEEFKGITSIKNISLIKFIFSETNNFIEYIGKISNLIILLDLSIYLFKISISQKKIIICSKERTVLKLIQEIKKKYLIHLESKIFKKITISNKLEMISIIGLNIKNHKKSIKKINNIIHFFKNKIKLLTYNTSEISVSFLLKQEENHLNLNKIHELVFYKKKEIEIFIIGKGKIGKELILQINKQKEEIKKNNKFLKIVLIADSKKYLYKKNGINLNVWDVDFEKSKNKFSIEKILKLSNNNEITKSVFIDCTSSTEITKNYLNLIKNGFHIIASNKKYNSSSINYYKKIKKKSIFYNKKFLYETNVGAGLPILKNLKNLILTGDSIIDFKGVLSGSMSFIFGQLDQGLTLSEATRKAYNLGLMEPDIREDLSGKDISRKILILAREMNFNLEISDIKIDEIIPSYFYKFKNNEEIIYNLKKIDNFFIKKIKEAKKMGKRLQFVGVIEKNGHSSVKIEKIDIKNPLYEINNGENVFIFRTKYYNPIPLTIRGYGAGIKVTASGIFSDLLSI